MSARDEFREFRGFVIGALLGAAILIGALLLVQVLIASVTP